ncbi:MAG: tyrosine-protein phosphatase [Bacilli bacterium]|nr:tyrosine-protein phosphatase [Bacilli bacterium]
MKKTLKFIITLLLPFTFIVTGCANKSFEIEATVDRISNPIFNNIGFDINCAQFAAAGFDYYDLIYVTFYDYDGKGNDITYDTAYVKAYNEVGNFAPCLCNYENKSDTFDFSFGIEPLKKKAQDLVDRHVKVKFKLNKKQGYAHVHQLIDLSRRMSLAETGYDNLAFANFRDVSSIGSIYPEGVGSKRLYRGSSPFNPKDNPEGRDIVADKLISVHEIESEVSLANDDEQVEKLMNDIASDPTRRLSNTYVKYQQSKTPGIELKERDFFAVCLAADFYTTGVPLKDGDAVKAVFHYMSERISNSKTTFYIHCNEGKDRTGFIIMVLEALAGVSLKDILSDYMLTFKNYYNITEINNKEQYDKIADLLVYRHIYSILLNDPINDLSGTDWYTFDAKKEVMDIVGDESNNIKLHAKNYLENVIGVSSSDVTTIEHWLKTDL